MDSNEKVRPRLVKLEKAFKLAEMWVNGLSGPPPGGDQNDLELIGRPERLGLGAKITPNVRTSSANPASSANPVERKIHGALKAIKEKSSESFEKANPAEQNRPEENDDDDDEPESRIKALTKRKAQPTFTPRQPTKRLK